MDIACQKSIALRARATKVRAKHAYRVISILFDVQVFPRRLSDDRTNSIFGRNYLIITSAIIEIENYVFRDIRDTFPFLIVT